MQRAHDADPAGADEGVPRGVPAAAMSPRSRRGPSGHARRGRSVAWAVIAAVLTIGVLAQLVRPLAPDLGAVPAPAGWFDPELLRRIDAYSTPLRVAALVGLAVDLAVPLVIACTAPGRRLVSRIVAAVGAGRVARAAAAVVAAVVLLTGLARLPLGWWAYRHATAFGLSTQSPAGWFGDWAITRGIELAVAIGLAMAGYALVRRRPQDWYLIAAPLGVVVIAAAVLVTPLVIEPLRFDFAPLPDGTLRDRLEEVLAADGRPRANLLVADASRRTIMQNAYVSGLSGTRRVVLYDTLLERAPDEVAQVLAHELAHERHHDLARGVLAGAVGWVVLCLLVAGALRWRVTRGRQHDEHDPRGAGAVVAVIVVALTLSTPLTAWHSRRAEAAADLGALRLTGDAATFCAMQLGLVERNLSDPAPPTWRRLWSSTHPPAASRIALAQWWHEGEGDRQVAGGRGSGQGEGDRQVAGATGGCGG